MNAVLGVGGSIHDFAACLLVGKKMIAIEDERITRKRYAINSPNPCQPSVNYCLKQAQITLDDLDMIIANDDLIKVIDAFSHPKKELINHHLSHVLVPFLPLALKRRQFW